MEIENPRIELDVGRRLGTSAIALAISRVVRASGTPAVCQARCARLIIRCAGGLQRLAANTDGISNRAVSVCGHATCANKISTFGRVPPPPSWHLACSALRAVDQQSGPPTRRRLPLAAMASGVGGSLLFLWPIRAAGGA